MFGSWVARPLEKLAPRSSFANVRHKPIVLHDLAIARERQARHDIRNHGKMKLLGMRPHQVIAVAVAAAVHCGAYLAVSNQDITPPPHLSHSPPVVTIELNAPKQSADEVGTTLSDSLQAAIDQLTQDMERSASPIAAPEPLQQPPAGPYYYRVSELTNAPLVLRDVREIQPLKLTGEKPQKVILRLLINEKGEIDQVLVQDSELSQEATTVLADKFSLMRFEPGKIDGAPVRSQITIEVDAAPTR